MSEAGNKLIKDWCDNNPDLGSGDESKCLPGWLDTFADLTANDEGFNMSASAVRALCHTLLGGRERVKRLVAANAKQEILYVAENKVPYESSHIVGIFSSPTKAKEACDHFEKLYGDVESRSLISPIKVDPALTDKLETYGLEQ